jgi:hypothetical protein
MEELYLHHLIGIIGKRVDLSLDNISKLKTILGGFRPKIDDFQPKRARNY